HQLTEREASVDRVEQRAILLLAGSQQRFAGGESVPCSGAGCGLAGLRSLPGVVAPTPHARKVSRADFSAIPAAAVKLASVLLAVLEQAVAHQTLPGRRDRLLRGARRPAEHAPRLFIGGVLALAELGQDLLHAGIAHRRQAHEKIRNLAAGHALRRRA